MYNNGNISGGGAQEGKYMNVISIIAKWTTFFILQAIIFQAGMFAVFPFTEVSLLCTLSSHWWVIVRFQRGQISVLEENTWQRLIFSFA